MKITAIVSNKFRPKRTFYKNKNELYNTPALTAVLDGSENWIIKAGDARRIIAIEMKYIGGK